MTATASQATDQFCLLRCNSRPIAVAVGAVQAFTEWAKAVPIPLCPPVIFGLVGHRREVVPVVRSVEELGRSETADAATPLICILRSERGPWGFGIDREGIIVVDGQARRAALPATQGLFATDGVLERAGAGYAILDVERTWQQIRRQIETWYEELQRGE